VRLLPYLRDKMSPVVEIQEDDAREFLPQCEAPTWLNAGKADPTVPWHSLARSFIDRSRTVPN
jgi:hypothetical protein